MCLVDLQKVHQKNLETLRDSKAMLTLSCCHFFWVMWGLSCVCYRRQQQEYPRKPQPLYEAALSVRQPHRHLCVEIDFDITGLW